VQQKKRVCWREKEYIIFDKNKCYTFIQIDRVHQYNVKATTHKALWKALILHIRLSLLLRRLLILLLFVNVLN